MHVLRQAVDAVRIPACCCGADVRVDVGERGQLAQVSSHVHGPEPRSQGTDVSVVCERSVRRIARRHWLRRSRPYHVRSVPSP